MCAGATLARVFVRMVQRPIHEPHGCCHLVMKTSMLVEKYRTEMPGGWLTILFLMLSVFSSYGTLFFVSCEHDPAAFLHSAARPSGIPGTMGHRAHRMHEEKCFFLRDSELQDG